MAFESALDIYQKNCNTYYLKDVAGLYDATYNLVGWNNGSTELRSNLTSISLVITNYASGATLDLSSILTANLNALKLSTREEPILLMINEAFITTNFTEEELSFLEDGIYTYIYTLVINGNTYVFESSFLNECNTGCCVRNKLATIGKGKCNEQEKREIMEYWALYQSLIAGAYRGNLLEGNEILQKLKKWCGNHKCC